MHIAVQLDAKATQSTVRRPGGPEISLNEARPAQQTYGRAERLLHAHPIIVAPLSKLLRLPFDLCQHATSSQARTVTSDCGFTLAGSKINLGRCSSTGPAHFLLVADQSNCPFGVPYSALTRIYKLGLGGICGSWFDGVMG
jgi:hypothetical protein